MKISHVALGLGAIFTAFAVSSSLLSSAFDSSSRSHSTGITPDTKEENFSFPSSHSTTQNFSHSSHPSPSVFPPRSVQEDESSDLSTQFSSPRSSLSLLSSFDPPAGADNPPADAKSPSFTRNKKDSFVWPTGNTSEVLRAFSPPQQRWNAGHRGVDLASENNAPIYAAGKGRVIFAGILADRHVISIEHEGGLRTTYEPVLPHVLKGDYVEPGQIIGKLQAGHCPEQACLHWGAKHGSDQYIDPLGLLRPIIRLLK